MRQGKLLLGVVLMAGLIISTATVPVSAQEGQQPTESITASPSSETFDINAGDTKRSSMKIINDGQVAYDFIVYARPYSVINENYDPNFSTVKTNTNVHKWVQFDKTKYRLEPGQKATVTYTILVPADAAPGGHYGVIFAETQQREIGTTGVSRQKRVGNLVYARVNGKVQESGKFEEFIMPFWQRKSPVISSARVTNTGNVDFDTDVRTVAKDMFGRTKFTYTGDPVVLPDTTRLVQMNWDKAPNFGLFRVSQNVAFLDQKHANSGVILLAPVWFPILLGVTLLGGIVYAVLAYRKRRR